MSIATLEQTTITEEESRCELGKIAESIPSHQDYKLLLPRWSVCIECRGYNTNCPKHPDYLL